MSEQDNSVLVSNPKKLYVAILNKGWIRREHDVMLNEMRRTAGVEVVLEPLHLTWANPIFVNRNKIVKRFLATDCGFMMQIDNDVFPMGHNPAELVFADKDIIGSPAKVRQVGRAVNWVAYLKHPTLEYYAPIDFSKVDSTIDLLKVDVIGTGMICIKRRVLEAMKGEGGPFTIEMDADGIDTYGTDFAFCRRATAKGFEIFTTPQRLCEHIKELGLLDIQGYDDSDTRDFSSGKYNIPWGEWAISQRDWEFMRNVLWREKTQRVLEFGAGLSSLLMSEMADVVSYETDPEWMTFVNGRKTPENRLEVRLWDGVKLDEKEKENLRERKFDLCFVDGPPGKVNGGVGREEAIKLAIEFCDKIILHDAGRREEWGYQAEYLRETYTLSGRSGWHQARCHFWVKREAALQGGISDGNSPGA